ncbi:hypothetical protein [Pseudohongiella sp.]|uniref:Uncharacterized protein n=1 Tax=marine sediment metagenome TaxID=412755 RepID=A0A0F9VY84_9ZZZZ|nr:hypothetical protein [Pseudohongiella sp.]HDZ07970.1 hypothetical protein [Pseudohongiella sp.]HEA64423.1 hypothetical protein [Pseudohongiella sp.]
MKRIRYTVTLSSPSFPYQESLVSLAPHLGKHFAGACCRPIDGIWAAEGHLYKSHYEGVVQEPGMQILISVLPEQKALAYQHIQSMIQTLKKDLALEIDWVHVESEEVEAGHFQLT